MTSYDPLAKWRRVQHTQADRPGGGEALKPYKCYVESSAPRMLWIKGAGTRADRAIAYSYLTELLTDTWSTITLTFALHFPRPVLVEIVGARLGPLAEALMTHSAFWIQEYEAEFFTPPADDAPIIKAIHIYDSQNPGDERRANH